MNLVEADGQPLDAAAARRLLASRDPHPGLRAHPQLPADTRLWAALQQAGGGVWGGCVYDVEAIVAIINAGVKALAEEDRS